MDKKIYSLNSYTMGCSGYATVSSRGGISLIGFSLKNLPDGEFCCLYYEYEVMLCGMVNKTRPCIQRELPVHASRPSFGVYRGGECVMFNGSPDALDAMQHFLSGDVSPSSPADPPCAIAAEINDGPPAASSGSQLYNGEAASANQANHDSPDRHIAETSYYEKNKELFASLLRNNSHITSLEELMPGSSWAMAPEGYIVGIIRDEKGTPLYLCYGVEGAAEQQAPSELMDYCHWLPENLCSPKGWWVLYQSAASGEALTV